MCSYHYINLWNIIGLPYRYYVSIIFPASCFPDASQIGTTKDQNCQITSFYLQFWITIKGSTEFKIFVLLLTLPLTRYDWSSPLHSVRPTKSVGDKDKIIIAVIKIVWSDYLYAHTLTHSPIWQENGPFHS